MSYKYEDIRNFYFENELGERIDCQKIDGNLFFYNVAGLGYEEEIEYVQIGNNFIPNKKRIKQNQISGDLEFYNMTYDEYCKFVDFILRATSLKLIYVPKKTIRTEYYRDIDLFKIDKSEEDEYNVLPCPIMMNCKSLWYEAKEIVYTIDPISNELRWDFKWDAVFASYDNRNIIFDNKGHTEAPFKLELNGEVVDPIISILEDEVIVKQLDLTGLTITEGEAFTYNTKDTEQAIYKQKDRVETNLFDFLNPNFINFYKLRKGVSTIRLEADGEITSGKLTIYVQYKAV